MDKTSSEELKNFVYTVSHDLNAPLRHIKEFSRLLARSLEGKLNEKENLYINLIKNSAEESSNMLEALLQYSRLNTIINPKVEFEVSDVMENLGKNLRDKILRSNATIIINNLPKIKGDKERIEKLFFNLLDNSLKFRKKDLDPKIIIDSSDEGDKWWFSISDNGIGIKQENCSKVFDVFCNIRSKEEYPGTRIGLATCKKIVENHGGTIKVVSGPDGSSFQFTLAKS